MRLSDAFKLAYTKLRVRKLRTVISLLTASLLFSVLVAGSLIATGALQSLDAFSKEGFSNRYIVSGLYQNYGEMSFQNESGLIVRAEQLEKQEIAAKKAAAKRLDITFDDKTIDQSTQAVLTDPSGAKHLNGMSKYALQAIAEQEATNPNKLTFEKFKLQVGQADHFYRGMMRDTTRADQPAMVLIKDGKELNDVNNSGAYYGAGYGMGSNKTGLQTVTDEWNLLDNELLLPFVLKGENLTIGSDGSLPIIASYAAAQEVLKLPALTKNATAQEKKSRLETVRSQIAGKTFEICYRNNSSSAAYQAALQQQEYIRQNSGKPDYQKPELIYKPSEVPCQTPLVVRDVRTADAKLYQKHQNEFDRQFGKVDSYNQVLKFRIVGVAQDSPYANGVQGGAMGITDILSTVMASSVGARWVSPMSIRDSSPATKDVFALAPVQLYNSQEAYFAEYQDAQTARTVLTTKTCRPAFDIPAEAVTSIPTCSDKGTSYVLAPFGSASLAIDDFRNTFHRVQLLAALVIGVIAAVILIGMIGRIIADARRETAVFRATGASRFMVAQIYLAYTLCLVGLMIIMALVLGFSVALWVNSQYSADTSISMALLFNVTDLSKQFTFYALEPYDIGVISLAVLAAAFIGAVIPISSNIQRNPIRDMRDE